MDGSVNIAALLEEVLRFRDDRDWRQFHTLKNLAAAVSIETSELQELLLWKTDSEAQGFVQSVKGKRRLEEEVADVLIFMLLLCFEAKIDLGMAVQRKLVTNAKKYPVQLAKGNALKYSELRSRDVEERHSSPEEGDAPPLHEQFCLFPGGRSPVQ